MLPIAMSLALALPSARAAEPDLDADGFTASFDCDDTDAAVNPGATETCDDIDDDCDGLVDDDDSEVDGQVRSWPDVDGDGLGGDPYVTACVRPRGYIRVGGDCDDADASVGAPILVSVDLDGDGYGGNTTTYFCPPIPSGWTPFSLYDCDDADPAVNPSTPEVCNDGDDNCDDLVDEEDPALVGNTFYDDADRDGYGDDATADSTGCTQPHDYVAVGGDCAPLDVATHPNAPEVCDGEDNDCDGAVDDSTVSVQWYADADGDGYGVSSDIVRGCAQPRGYARGRGDCDDGDADVSPLSEEICGNGVDDDCDGAKDNCALLADDVADAVIQTSESSWFGAALHAGDVDGDGVSELFVSAPYASSSRGRVFAFTGPIAGSLSVTDARLTFSGSTGSLGQWAFGMSFVYQDANGDGYDDLLVGTPDPALPKAYVFLGPLTADATGDDADATFWNDGYSTAFGTSVEVLGDHDGDGIPDLVFGIPGTDFKDGNVAVISGDSVGGHNVRDDGTYNYRSKHDRCGQSLATLDGNGDGLDDFLVGAPMGATAYLLDGGLDHGMHSVGDDAQATFVGDWPAASFGWDVAAGDLDGDGYADAVITAPNAITSAGQATGAVYAFLGPLSGTADARLADTRWEGEADYSYGGFGYSVATGSDVDGDGEIDTLIGDEYVRAANAGAVYLQLGTARGIVTVDRMTTFIGSDGDWLGQDVAFVPDWSGDGLAEVAAGAGYAVDDAGAIVGTVSVFSSDSLFE